MARPRDFYRGEKRSTWIVTLILLVVAAGVIVFGWLFYSLQKDVVYEKDGLRLVPDPEAELRRDGSAAGQSGQPLELLQDVEIVVDKTDYSAVKTTAGEGLTAIRARFIPADSMTPTVLDSYTSGMGDYNALVLELKPSSGVLSYASAIPMASSYGVNGSLDLRTYADKMKEKGVYLVAQISGLIDSTMAVRYGQIALKNAATGQTYMNDGYGWLDPYSDQTRTYVSGLLEELGTMGFDEVLLSGIWCPSGDLVQFSTIMTETPDTESAVSSFLLYLRRYAESIGLKLSGVAEPAVIRGGEGAGLGQDLAVFFKALDRVAFVDDGYSFNDSVSALSSAAGGDGETRVLPICTGYLPDYPSYVVR